MSPQNPTEADVRWRALLISDPSRIVELLRLDDSTPMTDDGDTGEDLAPVLRALMDLVLGQPRPEQTKQWERLVEVGLANALCAIIADRNMLANEAKLRDDEDATGWNSALTIFSRWVISIQDLNRPTRTDKEVVASLKMNWSAMMKRLWDDPQRSTYRVDAHVKDRLCVPWILGRASRIDPALFVIARELDDFTIPVVARHWANSTDSKHGDMAYTSALLDDLCHGSEHPTVKAYLKNHPHSTTPAFVERFLLGVSPTPDASEPEKRQALIEIVERQLPLLGEVTAQIHQLRILSDLAKIDYRRTGLRKELVHRPMLWKVTFAALLTGGSENGPLVGLLLETILYLSIEVILITMPDEDSPSDYEPEALDAVVEAFVDGGFFDALDACVSAKPNSLGLVSIAEAAGIEPMLTTIWHAMNVSAEQSPRIRAKLASELPRSRTLAALLHRYNVWNANNQEKSLGLHLRLAANLPGWEEREHEGLMMNGMWQELALLQNRCKPTDHCNRRGCGLRASARCSQCRIATYCSGSCQKTDWSEHKLMCKKGWMDFIGDIAA